VDSVAPQTAKVFWSGRSQAVRLPRAYRLNSSEVRIRRHGSALILEPIATDWTWLDGLPGALGHDAADAALEPVEPQLRPALEGAFEG
jgi:antitoxin VapB